RSFQPVRTSSAPNQTRSARIRLLIGGPRTFDKISRCDSLLICKDIFAFVFTLPSRVVPYQGSEGKPSLQDAIAMNSFLSKLWNGMRAFRSAQGGHVAITFAVSLVP